MTAFVRQRIEQGDLVPNRPTPSGVQIEQEFGVARATARKAVALLREWGLVTTVPGLSSR